MNKHSTQSHLHDKGLILNGKMITHKYLMASMGIISSFVLLVLKSNTICFVIILLIL